MVASTPVHAQLSLGDVIQAPVEEAVEETVEEALEEEIVDQLEEAIVEQIEETGLSLGEVILEEAVDEN